MAEHEAAYLKAALMHSRATDRGDSNGANAAYDVLIKALEGIRSASDQGVDFLCHLTNHQDLGVRTWAATHLLPYNEPLAVRILEEIIPHQGFSAFSAKIVLREWRAGRLKT